MVTTSTRECLRVQAAGFSRDTAAIKLFLTAALKQVCSVDGAKHMARPSPRAHVNWRGARKSLVLIGDDRPHTASYAQHPENIDWRAETLALRSQLGVAVHSVQCFDRPEAGQFWTELASLGSGEHLSLSAAEFQRGNAHRLFTAICMASVGTRELKRFEKEMVRQTKGGLTDENKKWFQRLVRLSKRIVPAAGTQPWQPLW